MISLPTAVAAAEGEGEEGIPLGGQPRLGRSFGEFVSKRLKSSRKELRWMWMLSLETDGWRGLNGWMAG